MGVDDAFLFFPFFVVTGDGRAPSAAVAAQALIALTFQLAAGFRYDILYSALGGKEEDTSRVKSTDEWRAEDKEHRWLRNLWFS